LGVAVADSTLRLCCAVAGCLLLSCLLRVIGGHAQLDVD
jgi:hypothetical protein